MTAKGRGPAVPEPPAGYPPPKLTTSELARYRDELQDALGTLPARAEVSTVLRQRLTEVITEQESRARWRRKEGPR